MTSIIRDLEEIYMHPSASEMVFSGPDDPQTVPVYLRVEIDAISRSNWHIEDVYMLEEESSYNRDGVMRADEVPTKLQGEFKAYAINFILSQYEEDLQERVDLEIIPPVEEPMLQW